AVIIDDQTAVRQMLEFVVAMETGFTVAGSAGDGKQAWELCERTKPDLVILEVLLPKLNGLEILKRLREHFPSTRTLVFSAYQNLTVVKEAMRAGAHGYVEKSAPLADLKEGIRAVSE